MWRTIARLASRWSSAGSLLTYATVSLGPSWGLYSGIVYTTANVAPDRRGVAFLAHITGAFFQFHAAFSELVLACITSLAIGLICYQGVQLSTRVQLLITAVSAFFVLLLGIVIIVQRSTTGGGVPHGGHGMKIPRLPGTAFLELLRGSGSRCCRPQLLLFFRFLQGDSFRTFNFCRIRVGRCVRRGDERCPPHCPEGNCFHRDNMWTVLLVGVGHTGTGI